MTGQAIKKPHKFHRVSKNSYVIRSKVPSDFERPRAVKPSKRFGPVLGERASPSFVNVLSLTNVSELMRDGVFKERLINLKFVSQCLEGFHHGLYLLLIFLQPLFIFEPSYYKVDQYH